MIETNTEKKTRNRFPDRFTVDPANLEKVGTLLEQLRSELRGCDATRKDMLNWIIERFPAQLGSADLEELSKRFYDEERFLRLALEEVRAAKARGERKTLEDIFQKAAPAETQKKRRGRRKKNQEGGIEAPIDISEVAAI